MRDSARENSWRLKFIHGTMTDCVFFDASKFHYVTATRQAMSRQDPLATEQSFEKADEKTLNCKLEIFKVA
jgi:hypothetical protein